MSKAKAATATQEDREVTEDFQAQTTGTELAQADERSLSNDASNPFEEIARQAPRRIVGDLLKFSKGDYMFGQSNDEMPVGTRLIANMDQLLVGWIRWEDSKPVEQLMGLIVDGFKPAKRDELGFGYTPGSKEVDTSDWEIDPSSNQPRDPWQKTYYLLVRELDKDGKPMEGDEGLYTFTTSSKGGVDAIIDLCAKYGKWMRVNAGKFPVITLRVDKYTHPNKQYGIIKTPKFEFNPKKDWIAKDQFGEISEAPPEGDDGEDIPF